MLSQSTSDISVGNQANSFGDINESALLDILKGYYVLCKQTTDKRALIKDQMLVSLLAALLMDQRQSISVYICKILLSLSERPQDAKLLVEEKELRGQLDKAFSVDAAGGVPPNPKVLGKLLKVQARINCAASPVNEKTTTKKTIFGLQRSRQMVFAFDSLSEQQQREIERKCVKTPGVVSICFQQHGPDEIRCLIRCREHVEDQCLIQAILSTPDLDMVKQLVRGEDGQTEAYEFYASEIEERKAQNEWRNEKQLPKYLDDDQDMFDAAPQCIATKEQVDAQGRSGGGWLSSLTSMLW